MVIFYIAILYLGYYILVPEKVIFAIIRLVAISFHIGARGVLYRCVINFIGLVYFCQRPNVAELETIQLSGQSHRIKKGRRGKLNFAGSSKGLTTCSRRYFMST